MNTRRAHWRFRILRWHRRAGVLLALFVLWMAGSGLLLNHAHDLGWDRQAVQSSFWLHWYGLGQPWQLMLGSRRLELREGSVWLQGQAQGACPQLLAVLPVQSDLRLVACPQLLLLLTAEGEVVDRQDAAHGLLQTLQAAATTQGQVFVRDAQGVWRFQADDMSLQPVTLPPTALAWPLPQQPVATISRERWLQDLHSGRLWGKYGPWLTDVFAISLIMLACSGWFLARRRHPRISSL